MKTRLLLVLLFVLTLSRSYCQTEKLWTPVQNKNIITSKNVTRISFPKEFNLYNLNIDPLRQVLFSAINRNSSQGVIITLPNTKGEIEQFEMFEASNFESALQAQFPEIRAYSGKGITDKYATVKLSISPQGIQTMVFRTDKENEFMEPYSQDGKIYAVFNSNRAKGNLAWTCSVEDKNMMTDVNKQLPNTNKSSAGQLKTMRLAQSCTGEYAAYFGATTAGTAADQVKVLAAFNATLTRCNGVYEKDLALHLNLVANTTNVIFYNAATDPYSAGATGAGGAWNAELQNTLSSRLTGVGTSLAANNAAYDIGHLFGASGGGGNAGCIGCVCVNDTASTSDANKGSGFTSPSDNIPMGDNFDIDYVTHEVGHQLGGNHTFSNSSEGTGVNMEVGSGITIMGYAGITAQDIAPHSIDFFHAASIAQIQTNLAGKACPITTSLTGNNATPVANAGLDYTIPKSTPFILTGSATDANAGDALTYSWEQYDDCGNQTGANSVAAIAKTVGPNWRSWSATASPSRYMPILASVIANSATTNGTGNDGIRVEALSSVARTLNFRLTVRDNVPYSASAPIKVGQTSFDNMVVTVNGTAGPFLVTAPNTNVSFVEGTTTTVTWNVAGTTANGVNAANVDIFLSRDGGNTYPITLATAVANNGSRVVTLPYGASTTNRVMVKGANHIFYDISNTNFTITAGPPVAIATTVTNETCGSANGQVVLGAVTGGTAPYTYNFNNLGYSATITYSGLVAGTYSLLVKDNSGNIYTTSVTITNTPGPTAIATTIVNSSCGAANGSVTLGAVTGGTTPYTYSFNGSGFTTTTSYTALLAGSYTIIVKDANSCTFTTTATIIDNSGPTAIATTIVNETCGASDGSVTFGTVTGGTTPYTYDFNNLGYSGTTSYSTLAAGTYSLNVKDANGCIYTTSITITNSSAVTSIASTIVNETCSASNGSVTLGAITGGTSPYMFDFNNLGYSGVTNYTGLSAGTYTLNVKDANGCIYNTTFTILNSAPTAIATTIVNESCGTSNGSVTLGSVTGGTAPYTYDLNVAGFSTTTIYTGLSAGCYTLDVKDTNGCIYSTTVCLTNTAAPTAIVTTVVDGVCGTSNGSVTLGSVTGGTAPYTYNFNNLGFSGSTSYTGLSAGTYSLDVKDANGCIYSTTVTIADSPGVTNVATTIVNTTCGAPNGSITLGTVTGGVAPFIYQFNNVGYTSVTTYTGLTAGCYPIDVKDANGCIYSTSVCLTNTGGATAIATTVVNESCGASNGSISIDSVTGGTAPYTYNFNASVFSTVSTFTNLPAGCYSLEVKDANGCIYSTSICITNSAATTANISYAGLPFCNSDATPHAVTLTGTGAYTGGAYSAAPAGLSINTVTGDIIASTSVCGTYTVSYIVTGSGGCPNTTATTTVTIVCSSTTMISCGPNTTSSVEFDWTAVATATGYDVSYQINGGTAVVIGNVGNVLVYTVSGLAPSDVVVITVTPTGGSACFSAITQSCNAATLGVEGFENTIFSVYPNPTTGIINIVLKNSANTIDSVIVHDVLGKTIQTQKSHTANTTIDLSNFSQGVYFVRIKSGETEKVVRVIKM